MELGWVKNIDKLEEALSLESFLFKKDGHVELQKCLRTATKRRKKGHNHLVELCLLPHSVRLRGHRKTLCYGHINSKQTIKYLLKRPFFPFKTVPQPVQKSPVLISLG